MADFKIEVLGIDALVAKLRRNATLEDVKQIVKNNGAELDNLMKRNAVFIRGYSVGDTKRSINLKLEDGGFTAKVAPQTHYAPYVEYGTRKMSPQPFVRPSFDVQKEKFKNDMSRIMK